jgi:hypothetical protein
MRKYTLPLIFSSILLFSSTFSSAQKNTDSKFFYGGNLGLMFGTYTIIDISPEVGYRVTEKFHVGTGFNYTYYKYKQDGTYNGSNPTDGVSYSSSIYGVRFFTRFYVLDNIFLHVEDDYINLDLPTYPELYPKYDVSLRRLWLNSVLVGGGYGYAFNVDGPWLSMTVLFRVNHNIYDDFYPYQNPIIRIGLGFGF